MASPFDYVKNINYKSSYDYDLSGYVPFLTNRAFAMHLDTVMLAEEMNQYHQLDPALQYEFYYHAVRKGKRFGFPPKPEQVDNLDAICEYFNYSKQKALEALEILTPQEVQEITKPKDKGGRV